MFIILISQIERDPLLHYHTLRKKTKKTKTNNPQLLFLPLCNVTKRLVVLTFESKENLSFRCSTSFWTRKLKLALPDCFLQRSPFSIKQQV